MHQRKGAAANGTHRAGAVGLQNLGYHANSIWEFLNGRNNWNQSSLSQSAMTDFTTSRTTNRTSLTYRIAREVVLMNVVLGSLNTEAVKNLLITKRTQGSNCENLGLTTGKEARTMWTRQNANFTAYRTNLLNLTTVRTNLLLGNHTAYDFLNDFVKHIWNFLDGIRIKLQEMLHSFSLNIGNILITGQLIRVADSLIQLVSSVLTNSLFQLLWNSKELNLALLLATSLLDFILESNDLLDFLMTKEDSLQNNFFRKLISTSLNHHYCITGAGNGQIKVRNLTLLNIRVDNKLSINATNTNTSYWTKERNIGNSQSTGCTNHSRNLWSVVMLYGHNCSYNLNIITITLWEQRTDRTVNETAAQNGRLPWTSLSLYKTAWNLTNGVHLFFIIHSQREEINTLSWLIRSRSCNQNNSLSIAHQNSTICLLSHFSGLNSKCAAA